MICQNTAKTGFAPVRVASEGPRVVRLYYAVVLCYLCICPCICPCHQANNPGWKLVKTYIFVWNIALTHLGTKEKIKVIWGHWNFKSATYYYWEVCSGDVTVHFNSMTAIFSQCCYTAKCMLGFSKVCKVQDFAVWCNMKLIHTEGWISW